MEGRALRTKLSHPGTVATSLAMLIALITVSLAGVVLNAVSLVVMAALFFACILVIPAEELSAFYRYTLWVFVFGFFLHTWYELFHSGLYTDFSEFDYLLIVVIIFISAIADGFISVLLLFVATLLRRGKWDWTPPWDRRAAVLIVAIALLVQGTGEWVAITTDRWGYNQYMPVVPGLGVGLTPLLQMPLLILITFWLAQRAACLVLRPQRLSDGVG
jgi:hypothetical protein